MDPITLAAIALGGVILLGGKKKRRHVVSWGVKGPEDRLMWLNEIRSMSFWVTNEYGTMPYLADFLTITAFRGSRFNPGMVNSEIKTNWNAARGLFDMRPETAGKGDLSFILGNPSALNNPYINFVAAFSHIVRGVGRIISEGSGNPDWMAMRRWWALPYLIHDFNESNNESTQIRYRFEEAIDDCNSTYGTEIDPDFIWAPVGMGAPPSASELLQAFSGVLAA